MPKKSKKGSGKMAKMTEEQRLLYEEDMKREEENMKKKKEQTLNQYLKVKLQHEEKAAQLNMWKLNHQWRNIMREMKSKELRKEIEILSQTFERIIDRKDSVLKSLIKNLGEADEQYLVALRSHMISMDDLISIHQERLDNLRTAYQDELTTIKEEFDTEQKFMIEQHHKQIDDLKDILVAFDIHYTNKEQEAQSEFSNTCDEITNKNMEDNHALKTSLSKKVDELWEQNKAVTDNYISATSERQNQLEALKIKDDKSAATINKQMRKIQKLSDQINAVKGKLSNVSKDYDDKNCRLRDEKDRLVCQFQLMKLKMNQLRDSQREKLTKLSLESNEAMNKLKELTDKAERIIKYGEMCRKLETEEEKVLPFYSSSLTEEEEADVKSALADDAGGLDEWADLLKRYAPLENFWKRFNKVKLDRLAAEKERNALHNENMRLRSMLKQYLDGVSVNSEVLDNRNSLIVINGKTNVNFGTETMDPRVKPAPNVQIEAAHVVKYGVTSQTLFK